ncbi:OmpA family protein [Thalassotalea euphylliae]|uniref:OmpA family protein n=1 Tax=Thalassotalea euphylliae TaxID=1655234 RepID=A0A3E0U7U7_9GAMM|nr:OmpA family protein [Thalassotalea euphylliae]REL31982.1 OmpA family protein [Thalassotalea euphylliae]
MKHTLLSAIVLASSALVLTGCSSSNERTADGNVAALSPEQLVLKEYLQASRLKMMSLTTRLSHQCVAGQLEVGYRLLDKTEQEFTGQMYADAFISLTQLDRQVRKLECISHYIDGRFGCSETNKVTVLRDWYKEGSFEQCQVAILSADSYSQEQSQNQGRKQQQVQKAGNNVSVHGYTVITETLHDFDQAKLKSIYYPALEKLVLLMKSFPESTLVITGHADSRGSTEYNQTLSLARAEQVASYFIDSGIAAEKVTIEAFGEMAPRVGEVNQTQQVFNRYTKISLRLALPSQAATQQLKSNQLIAVNGKESHDE